MSDFSMTLIMSTVCPHCAQPKCLERFYTYMEVCVSSSPSSTPELKRVEQNFYAWESLGIGCAGSFSHLLQASKGSASVH